MSKQFRYLSTTLIALMVVGVLVFGRGNAPAPPAEPRLELVTREGRPWLLWQGPEPSGVVFQMEARSRLETIGVAAQVASRHAVELAGWLGQGPVTITARPDHGPVPPSLTLSPSDLKGYLDDLAEKVVTGDTGAWRRLGRFSSLYFSGDQGSWESKRRLQSYLVSRGPEAGPGGARWLWGEVHGPRRFSGLPGAPRKGAPAAVPARSGPGGSPMAIRLPGVEADEVELEVRVEVSPTPAGDYTLIAELSTGWTARLEPGPEGGLAFQRLAPRALEPGGTGCLLRVEAGPEAPSDLRVALVEVGLRYLPRARSPDA